MNIETLLVVYKKKDEDLFLHIRNLVALYDDEPEKIVGTKDGSVVILHCDEETWLRHIKAGRQEKLSDKILFIDDIKGTTYQLPIFSRYGVSYGFDGKSIVLSIDSNYEWEREEYDEFLKDLRKFSNDEVVMIDGLKGREERALNRNDKKDIMMAAGGFLFPPLHVMEAGKKAKLLKESLDDAKAIRSQMIIYGLSMLYYNHLEKFMNE